MAMRRGSVGVEFETRNESSKKIEKNSPGSATQRMRQPQINIDGCDCGAPMPAVSLIYNVTATRLWLREIRVADRRRMRIDTSHADCTVPGHVVASPCKFHSPLSRAKIQTHEAVRSPCHIATRATGGCCKSSSISDRLSRVICE
eukprot:s2558_g2.t1